MVRKKSYISRNFPPERNRVELAPVPSSTPRVGCGLKFY